MFKKRDPSGSLQVQVLSREEGKQPDADAASDDPGALSSLSGEGGAEPQPQPDGSPVPQQPGPADCVMRRRSPWRAFRDAASAVRRPFSKARARTCPYDPPRRQQEQQRQRQPPQQHQQPSPGGKSSSALPPPSVLLSAEGLSIAEATIMALEPREEDSPRPTETPRRQQQHRLSTLSKIDFNLAGIVHVRNKAWFLILALAAFMDFASTVLLAWTHQHSTAVLLAAAAAADTDDNFSYTKEQQGFALLLLQEREWQLSVVSNAFGIIFSILWCLDALVKAGEKRELATRKPGVLENGDEQWRAWIAYSLSVWIQLLLLPVGLYQILWCAIPLIGGIDAMYINSSAGRENPTASVLLTFLKHIAQHACLSLQAIAQRRNLKWESFRFLSKAAIRSPGSFGWRALQLLTFIRWVKCLLPVFAIGSKVHKLYNNFMDLLKRYKQCFIAKKIQRRRMRQWKHMTPYQQTELAASIIQAKWRSYRTRRLVAVLKSMRRAKELRAITRVQRICRGMLERARARLLKKELEFNELQQQRRKNPLLMSTVDRRRLHELDDELNNEAKDLLNQKLLLRPNSTFAVMWKLLIVVCIILEIGKLLYEPRLLKYSDKPMSLGKKFKLKLLPMPKNELEGCDSVFGDDETVEPRFWDIFWRTKKDIPLRGPWYCQGNFKTLHTIYVKTIRLLLSKALVIVGIIFSMDVLVTFFTGEFDAETGVLTPKPLIARYIFPGLLFHLLLNPKLARVSAFAWEVLQWILVRIGPIRVWRWVGALFYPLGKVLAFSIAEIRFYVR